MPDHLNSNLIILHSWNLSYKRHYLLICSYSPILITLSNILILKQTIVNNLGILCCSPNPHIHFHSNRIGITDNRELIRLKFCDLQEKDLYQTTHKMWASLLRSVNSFTEYRKWKLRHMKYNCTANTLTSAY